MLSSLPGSVECAIPSGPAWSCNRDHRWRDLTPTARTLNGACPSVTDTFLAGRLVRGLRKQPRVRFLNFDFVTARPHAEPQPYNIPGEPAMIP